MPGKKNTKTAIAVHRFSDYTDHHIARELLPIFIDGLKAAQHMTITNTKHAEGTVCRAFPSDDPTSAAYSWLIEAPSHETP